MAGEPNQKLDDAVAARIYIILTKTPNRQLTMLGFGMALIFSLQKFWPNLPRRECARLLWQELDLSGIKYGDPDYDWSYAAAQELAREYVSTYGESP